MMRIVRADEEKVFVILARKRHILTTNFSREKRHAFVLHAIAAQCEDSEMVEIVGLDQLRQSRATVVSRVGRVIHHAAVLLDEAHKARILDPVAFVG